MSSPFSSPQYITRKLLGTNIYTILNLQPTEFITGEDYKNLLSSGYGCLLFINYNINIFNQKNIYLIICVIYNIIV